MPDGRRPGHDRPAWTLHLEPRALAVAWTTADVLLSLSKDAIAPRDARNHDSVAMFPDQRYGVLKGRNMRKALTIAAMVMALAACRAHGGFGIGANDHQPTQLASVAQ